MFESTCISCACDVLGIGLVLNAEVDVVVRNWELIEPFSHCMITRSSSFHDAYRRKLDRRSKISHCDGMYNGKRRGSSAISQLRHVWIPDFSYAISKFQEILPCFIRMEAGINTEVFNLASCILLAVTFLSLVKCRSTTIDLEVPCVGEMWYLDHCPFLQQNPHRRHAHTYGHSPLFAVSMYLSKNLISYSNFCFWPQREETQAYLMPITCASWIQ